jgi:sensor histidine kinase YesM
MSVSDDGKGIPSSKIEQVFFSVGPRVHAMSLLRRRLHGLFGRSFRLEVGSDLGRGTVVTVRIPLRKQFKIADDSLETVPSDPGHLLSY